MKRTLMQLGIGALEEMFSTSKTDAKVLRQLENELQHRQVPRAVALLDEVQLAMKRVASSMPRPAQDELPLAPPVAPAAVPAHEAPVPERSAPEVAVTAPVSAPLPPSVPEQASSSQPKLPSRPPARVAHAPIPAMSLDAACKLLKVTVASQWQEVELARRKLILLSHPRHVVGMPEERQEAVRTEARRVNAAYAALSTARAK